MASPSWGYTHSKSKPTSNTDNVKEGKSERNIKARGTCNSVISQHDERISLDNVEDNIRTYSDGTKADRGQSAFDNKSEPRQYCCRLLCCSGFFTCHVFQSTRRVGPTMQSLQRTIDELQHRLHTQTECLRHMEEERDDALNRLSQLISVKMRDNNPNIVDLNDQYRPTKLAEMFSELYDNEWTEAYTLLESHRIDDVYSIKFLLDIIMGSFDFCREILEPTWLVVVKWFVDEDFPWIQQTKKALKDGRKIIVLRLAHEIDKVFTEHLSSICANKIIREILQQPKSAMTKYIAVCVKLCLLMCTNDPPVVFECPGWKPSFCHLPYLSKNIEVRERVVYKLLTSSPLVDDFHSHDNAHGRHEEQTDHSASPTGKDQSLTTNTHIDPHTFNNDSQELAEKEPTFGCRGLGLPFDKERFKEYTKRGEFLGFVVWPSMFLHTGGPVLGKGVAQPCDEVGDCAEDPIRSWWN